MEDIKRIDDALVGLTKKLGERGIVGEAVDPAGSQADSIIAVIEALTAAV